MIAGRRLLLIRHGEVHPSWRGVCYGCTDVGLSSRGRAQSLAVVRALSQERVTEVISSGLRRASYLAERLARQHRLVPKVCAALRERDFGSWERRSWEDIYAETDNAMEGMLLAPETWCPPGGETTFELRDRVLNWYAQLPTTGCIVVVTHGGPIAALVGTLSECSVAEWPNLVPLCGGMVTMTSPPSPDR